MTDLKTLVQRLVHEAINANDLDVLDELASPAVARTLRRAFEQFQAAFPDWRQDIIELVAESSTIVARFRCTGTHRGTWQGLAPTGRTMSIDEVYFFHTDGDRITQVWGLEDTWTRHKQLRGDPTHLGAHGSLS